MGLHTLFMADSAALGAELDGRHFDEVGPIVHERLRRLARPYSDESGVSDVQVRCARAGLESLAAGIAALSAAHAAADLRWVTEQTDESRKKGWRERYESARRFLPTGGMVMLILNAALCVAGVVLLIMYAPLALKLFAVVFALLALINLMGIPFARRPKALGATGSDEPVRTPHAVLRAGVDGDAAVAAIRTGLKQLDQLLSVVGDEQRRSGTSSSTAATSGDGIDHELSLDLLQAIVAGADEQLAKPAQWAASAVDLLEASGVRVVDYDGTNEHLFDQRPSGGSEVQMRLPALLSATGTVAMRRGVILVPVGA